MPGLADNYGYGIGLSGEPNMYASMYERKQARADAAAAKAAEEDQAAADKYTNDLNVKGVHRLDNADAVSDTGQALHQIQQLRQARPHNWRNGIDAILTPWKERQAERIVRKQALDKFTQQYGEAVKNGTNTPALDQAYKGITSGTWSDLQAVPKDITNSFNYDPQSKGFSANFLPNVNYRAVEKSALSDPKMLSQLQFINPGDVPSLPNGTKIQLTAASMPITQKDADALEQLYHKAYIPSLEDVNATLLSDPAYMKRKMHNFDFSKKLPANYNDLDDQGKYKAVFDANMEDLKSQAGTRVTQRSYTPMKQTEEEKNSFHDYGLDDMKSKHLLTENEVVTSVDPLQKNKVGGNKVAYTLPVRTQASTVVTLDANAFDPVTNQRIRNSQQYNFYPGSIKVLPIHDDKTGEIHYRAYVFGQAKDIGDGEAPSAAEMATAIRNKYAGIKTPGFKDLAVPLEKIENVFHNKPFNVPTRWAHEAVDQKNAELKSQKEAQGKFASRKRGADTTPEKKVKKDYSAYKRK